MAASVRPGTSSVVFVVALGVSAMGHVAVLAGRSESEPRPIEESASGWSGVEDAIQVFDASSVPEGPRASAASPPADEAPTTTTPTPPARADTATPKLAKPKAAPPPDALTTNPPRDTTPGAMPADKPQSNAPDDGRFLKPQGETDIEEGVITPRESWRAPPEKPHSPSLSGMPASPSPESPPASEEDRLAPGIARLETAFTRSVPYYNYADPAWEELPLGRVGSMKLEFVVDALGQIVEATPQERPPPVLERLRRRTLFGLRRGHFALTNAQVTAGRRTLRIDVFLEQRPVGSQALPAMGFRAPTNGRPGVATMHLESGRFVTVQVLAQGD